MRITIQEITHSAHMSDQVPQQQIGNHVAVCRTSRTVTYAAADIHDIDLVSYDLVSFVREPGFLCDEKVSNVCLLRKEGELKVMSDILTNH